MDDFNEIGVLEEELLTDFYKQYWVHIEGSIVMFLNEKYSREFRSAINSSNIFYKDENHKKNFSLFCAIMDRVDSSVSYLNSHSNRPNTENQFLFFIVHSCIIYDALKQLLFSLHIDYSFKDSENPDSFLYFKSICLSAPLNIPNDEVPTDDSFFEYLRSMIMAHPFNTSRPKFLEKNEIQYSPFIIAESVFAHVRGLDDAVGFRVYSNMKNNLEDVLFSFELLKEYVNSRYELFSLATSKIYELIEIKKKEWRKDKVDTSTTTLDSVKSIRRIMVARFLDTDDIDLVNEYLSIKCAIESPNYEVVCKYQSAIIASIPDLVNSIETLDHEELSRTLSLILNTRPKINIEMFDYMLEKIFGYLNKGDKMSEDYKWGLLQGIKLYDSFANKWVFIDFEDMDSDEIKMLFRISLYLEYLEQVK